MLVRKVETLCVDGCQLSALTLLTAAPHRTNGMKDHFGRKLSGGRGDGGSGGAALWVSLPEFVENGRSAMSFAQADAYNMAKLCSGTVTASDALAQSDKNAWLTSLKTTIGSGVSDTTTCGQIENCDDANATTCKITVYWDDTRAGGSNARSLSVEAQI